MQRFVHWKEYDLKAKITTKCVRQQIKAYKMKGKKARVMNQEYIFMYTYIFFFFFS